MLDPGILQTSFNPSDWYEDWRIERERMMITPNTSPAVLRRYFPLRIRLLKADSFRNFPEGTIFEYGHTKLTPHAFPIRVYTGLMPGSGFYATYAPSEAEIID